MDEINLILIKKLRENSRYSYRELADITNLSVSAVHKRITTLVDNGTIIAFIARPSNIALKCLHVLIFGTSGAKSMDAVSKELGQHENIIFVGIAGGKFLYISALVRDISELQDYSAYVSTTAQLSDPTVGIIDIPYLTIPKPLMPIDFRILKTLNRDSRKPIVDVAEEVGLSVKTVKKRLDLMMKNKLAEFSLEWLPLYKDSFITVFHLFLNEGTNLNSMFQHVAEKYSQNICYLFKYSNLPNFFTLHIWTKTPLDSQKILEELQTEGFKDVIPHLFLTARWFECWVDQLLKTY